MISRRHFFFGTLLAGVIPRGGFGSVPSLKALGYQSPNEKMNIAGIGAGGRAMSVLGGARVGEHRRARRRRLGPRRRRVQALGQGDEVQGLPPDARQGKEHRRGHRRHPDHMHATVALAAMQLGKHVYVEKPLTRTPWEARLLTDAAAKYKVATQMGNQGYSHEATRVAAEIIWSGEIGDVTEVHSFRGRASWPQGMQTLPAPEKVPDTLDWDLWLGGAAMRPLTSGDEAYRKEYNQQFGFYLPFNWRGFYDFGSSLIGDWGIHQLGPANLALRLGSPISVECIKQGEGRARTRSRAAASSIKWEFAARENMPPVTVYWSRHRRHLHAAGHDRRRDARDSRHRAEIDNGPAGAAAAGGGGRGRWRGRPSRSAGRPGAAGPDAAAGRRRSAAGQRLQHGLRRLEGFPRHRRTRRSVGLLPGSRWAEYKLPPRMLTRSPGHQRDWVRACKGGEPACSNFSIAGPYTEWMVLGAVAARVEGKLLWDPKKMEFTNNREANKFVKPVLPQGLGAEVAHVDGPG